MNGKGSNNRTSNFPQYWGNYDDIFRRKKMKICGIVAMDPNGLIGKENGIPWHYSEDFKFFKKTTLNQMVLMGRKTWESLPKKPLPKRDNIILSTTMGDVDGARVIKSPNEFSKLPNPDKKDLFIIGGSRVYAEFMHLMDELYVTNINKEYEGDTYFPIENYWNYFDHSKTIKRSDDFIIVKYYNHE